MSKGINIDISAEPVVKLDMRTTSLLVARLAEQLRNIPPVDLTDAVDDFSKAVRNHIKQTTGEDVVVTPELVDEVIEEIGITPQTD